MASSHLPSHHAAYSDLFAKMLDAVFLIETGTFVILDSNLAAQRLMETLPAQFRGRPLSDFVKAQEQAVFSRNLRSVQRRYYPREFEAVWWINVDKGITVSLNVCSLRLSDGK